MIHRDDITAIGKFQRTHALKGELNVVLDIDADFLQPDIPIIVEREGLPVPFYAESVRPKGHFSSLVKLHGIDSEAEASTFVNETIYARRSDVDEYQKEEGEDGLYADDLVGYRLMDSFAGEIGVIAALNLQTQNALFIVETPGGEVYVPAADDFISAIDTDNRIVHTDLPDGLLDINRQE